MWCCVVGLRGIRPKLHSFLVVSIRALSLIAATLPLQEQFWKHVLYVCFQGFAIPDST
jgi:hypothetical protein